MWSEKISLCTYVFVYTDTYISYMREESCILLNINIWRLRNVRTQSLSPLTFPFSTRSTSQYTVRHKLSFVISLTLSPHQSPYSMTPTSSTNTLIHLIKLNFYNKFLFYFHSFISFRIPFHSEKRWWLYKILLHLYPLHRTYTLTLTFTTHHRTFSCFFHIYTPKRSKKKNDWK